MLLMSLAFVLLWCTQWTHLRRFAIDSTSKLHVENSSRFHQFQNGNAQGNYDTIRRGNFDMDSTFKIGKISMSSPYGFLYVVSMSNQRNCFTRYFLSIIFEDFLL